MTMYNEDDRRVREDVEQELKGFRFRPMKLVSAFFFAVFWLLERLFTPVTFIMDVRYEKGFRRGQISYRNILQRTLVNRCFIWEDFKW